VLPGPEAHELCCYFGYLARGRIGALVAGLGFMLPGLVCMLALAWAYTRFGLRSPLVLAAFVGVQPVVAALIVRAVHRIGRHALRADAWLWAIAVAAFGATLAGVPSAIPLIVGGLAGLAAHRRMAWLAIALLLALLAVAGWMVLATGSEALATENATGYNPIPPTPIALGLLGLKAGLLTFGGAYTAIPFVREGAVAERGWLTDAQFLDGVGIAGVLPAPLVIFGTFVGFVGAGWWGALAMTAGVFAPAFAFTMIGHHVLERIVHHTPIHRFLDAVTAAVVGVIAATALDITLTTVGGPVSIAIFVAALLTVWTVRTRWIVPAIVLGGALAGIAAHAVLGHAR
jgi:chromate transporter